MCSANVPLTDVLAGAAADGVLTELERDRKLEVDGTVLVRCVGSSCTLVDEE